MPTRPKPGRNRPAKWSRPQGARLRHPEGAPAEGTPKKGHTGAMDVPLREAAPDTSDTHLYRRVRFGIMVASARGGESTGVPPFKNGDM
jgi:hypothetical protein